MNAYSVAPLIREHYPEYYGLQTYPQDQCVRIHKVAEEWGLFCNFASTPLEVNGYTFKSSEELFQMMKFKDREVLNNIKNGITNNGKKCHQIKKTVKSYEKTARRADWGTMIVDAMKFALMQKYEQCSAFRTLLEQTRGYYIVEDQTTMPKKEPDTWGVKPQGDDFVGPNLLGRLLMELRDNGKLEYHLPEDALDFIEALKH